MDEEMLMFVNNDSMSYLESLMRGRVHLKDTPLLSKLDVVIEAELELALMGAEKAKSEILKANKNNAVRPIK